MTADQRTGTIELPDGRTLTYADLGAAQGAAVFVLDGPGSRGLARAASAAAVAEGIRLVAPDRPGFGGSTAEPGRSITSFADDLVRLADALGLETFGVLGQSGGTPYALASAVQMPGRVRAVSLMGAVAPLGEPGALEGVRGQMRTSFKLARRAPWALRLMLRLAGSQARRDPERFAMRAVGDLPAADQAVLAAPEMRDIHVRTTAEIMSAPAEMAREVGLLTRPWGFDLADVYTPVSLWVGDRDTTHPPAMSRRLARRLPDATVQVVPDAATFGLAPHYADALRFCAAAPVR
ncbi:MAG: alpha/beta fold hydrolase [Solirubrobacterales bacterium]